MGVIKGFFKSLILLGIYLTLLFGLVHFIFIKI